MNEDSIRDEIAAELDNESRATATPSAVLDLDNLIDVDIETRALGPWTYRGDEPFTFLVQFGEGQYDENGEMIVDVLRHPEDREAIQEWLDHDADYIAWNTKFDLGGLEVVGYRLPPEHRWHDGMVIAHLVDERQRNALKIRGERMFGKGATAPEDALKKWLAEETKRRRKASKDAIYDWLEEQGHEQKRNKLPQVPPGLEVPEELRFVPPNYSDVPDEIMTPYAKMDIVLTRRITNSLWPKLQAAGLEPVYALEQRSLAAFYAMEKRGIPVDRGATERLALASAEKLSALEAEARELAGGKSNFNPNSSQQVAEALKREGAVLTYVTKGDDGKLSMDEENLSAVDHPLASAILAFRGEKKMLGTYVTPMLRPTTIRGIPRAPFIALDGRVHTSFNQVGARSGRTSSSDPNIQNWPRDDLRLRYLLHAPEGFKLVTADMDAIEARILAMYAGEGKLLHALNNGGDIHTITAEGVGLTGRQRTTGFESARQQGKTFNYLVSYGGGVRAIRKWFLVSQARAREMLDLYAETYPEVADLKDRIAWRLADRGYIETISGRRQRLETSVRKEGYKFIAYLMQGTGADMFKEALSSLHEDGVPLVGAFHDELVALVPEDEAEETAAKMSHALTNFPKVQQHVKLFAEADIVDRWSQAKDPDFIPDHEPQEVPA